MDYLQLKCDFSFNGGFFPAAERENTADANNSINAEEQKVPADVIERLNVISEDSGKRLEFLPRRRSFESLVSRNIQEKWSDLP